jgi:LPS sulfotransferase NodH/SAM-dependent methyltransferase
MEVTFESLTRGLEIDRSELDITIRTVAPADRKYVILFTPRSGSSWLTSLLSGVGCLGMPEEYLNPAFLRDVAESLNCMARTELFPALLRKCKSDNGVFGIEVRSIDIELFGEQNFLDGVGPDTLYFCLWRDNIVAQGISLYRAVTTGRWHSSDGRTEIGPTVYDAASIKEWIEHILQIENANFSLLCRRCIPCRFLCYEDVIGNDAVALEAFSSPLLGRALPSSPISGSAIRPTRMADDWNLAAEERFRHEMAEFLQGLCQRRLIRTDQAVTQFAAGREELNGTHLAMTAFCRPINREWRDRYVNESRELANHPWEKTIMRPEVRLVSETEVLPHANMIYQNLSGIDPASNSQRFHHWWTWASQNGLNDGEYVLPQLLVPTAIEPFTFERRFIQDRRTPPSQAEINDLAPWVYQVEFGATSTRGVRDDADWKYHRYRGSLLAGTATQIAGPRIGELSVLDVGSHCGVQALELAERGFGHVVGVDLRSANIRQARYLMSTFGSRRVSFDERNVWDLESFPSHDVVFCAGLLYHVTYPLRLLKILHDLTNEFLILDSLVHKHPFSGFYLVCNKDVAYSAEGEFSYELQPTYRAVCEGLQAVGFTTIYEVIGDKAGEVPLYESGIVRTFVAAKHSGGLLGKFVAPIAQA